jgi:hypothetical protein
MAHHFWEPILKQGKKILAIRGAKERSDVLWEILGDEEETMDQDNGMADRIKHADDRDAVTAAIMAIAHNRSSSIEDLAHLQAVLAALLAHVSSQAAAEGMSRAVMDIQAGE